MHTKVSDLKEIYVSCEIEADGPIPGMNSMLSYACVAFQDDAEISSITNNLERLIGATSSQEVMAFWHSNPTAYKVIRQDLISPKVGMDLLNKWLNEIRTLGKPVFVGYPATFDFMFLYWYLVRFGHHPVPFGFSGCDIKSMAYAYNLSTGKDDRFSKANKRKFPKKWFEGAPRHTHVPLDDAREQGMLFLSIKKALQGNES